MKTDLCFRFAAILLFLLGSVGCSLNPELSAKETLFSEMNKDVIFTDYFKITVLSDGDGLFTLVYENISSNKINIKVPDEHEIFFYDTSSEQWKTIPDLMHRIYQPLDEKRGFILLDTKEGYARGGNRDYYTLVIKPDGSELEKPVSIRVLLVGEIAENPKQSETKVGGFVDFLIE